MEIKYRIYGVEGKVYDEALTKDELMQRYPDRPDEDFIPVEIVHIDTTNYPLIAKQELVKSDGVALRCAKAGVAYPQSWRDRDVKLRQVVNGEHKDIPDTPPYPEGT